jgi:lipopolysaccharide/colanic/teichoic acid biosynthesis glycosyltransferase
MPLEVAMLLAEERPSPPNHDLPRPEEPKLDLMREFPSDNMKRLIDVTASSILMVLFSPVIGLAALAVWLTSRGPIIYSQERLGLDGRSFTIFKLRTMRHNCERESGPRWAALSGDPRVTPIGQFLRATHIDELPQLWNVIRGDMSLVGPRPERPVFVAQLEKALPLYRERMSVRPGITGLAQVQLPPDTDLTSVRRKLACDLYYVQFANPWLDVRLMLSTALGVLGVPFVASEKLLRIPGMSMIEADYTKISATDTLVTQPQIA